MANACSIFITQRTFAPSLKHSLTAPLLAVLQDSAPNHRVILQLTYYKPSLLGPRGPQRQILIPRGCSGNVCGIASVALHWFWKQPASWHISLSAAQSSSHSRGSEFMLTSTIYTFTLGSIFSPSSWCLGLLACCVPRLCANFTMFGSVTIPKRPPGAGHMLFPGVLELFAECWLLLMALCGCPGSVLPVCLLMTASPTPSSHLFILAASPSLCSLF